IRQAAGTDRFQEDAAERRDPDPAGEDDGGPVGVVQAQVPEGPFDLDPGAQGHRLEHPLEGRVPQACGDHDHALAGRAGDREAACVALGVGLGRVEERDVDELAGPVGPVGRLRKAERHRPLGDELATDQGRLEGRPGSGCRHCAHVREAPAATGSLAATKPMRSATRQLNPHSLSYQATTLIKVPPITIVIDESMIDERLSPRKSDETRGSSLTPRMPFMGPASAARKAALSSSTDVGRATSAVKSTMLTVGVGTRRLKPLNLPSSSGMTTPRLRVAPLVVGTMFRPAALARRGSLWAVSSRRCEDVYECTVFIRPRSIVTRSWTTLTAGTRQFVVHEALLMMWCVSGSYPSSLTPRTTVKSAPDAGALMITFLAPASRWAWALPGSRNLPVDSSTMSTPRSPHGKAEGLDSLRTLISRPSTTRASSVCSTVP